METIAKFRRASNQSAIHERRVADWTDDVLADDDCVIVRDGDRRYDRSDDDETELPVPVAAAKRKPSARLVAKKQPATAQSAGERHRDFFLDHANEPLLRMTLRLGDGPPFGIQWPAYKGATAVPEFDGDGFPVLAITKRGEKAVCWRVEYPRAYAVCRLGYKPNQHIKRAVLVYCRRTMLQEAGLLRRGLLPPLSAKVERILDQQRAMRPLYLGLREQIAGESKAWHKKHGREQVMVRFTLEWARKRCRWPEDFTRLARRTQIDLIAEARRLLKKHGLIVQVGTWRQRLRYYIADE